jgi:hypothetical protein
MGATIVFVAVTAGASGAAPTDFRLVLDGKHNAALLHEGTFTTTASFCASGAAEDISVDGSTDTAQRRFRCGDGDDFVAQISPLPAEHGGTGVWQIVAGSGRLASLRGKGTFSSTRLGGRSDDPATITFRSTWTGVADFDVDPPRLAVAKASATKLHRPKGAYAVRLALSLEDAAGGPVSYQLEINEPRTRRGLAFRIGTAPSPTVNLTLRVKPPRGARTLQVKLSASDAVGNNATVTESLRLR